MVRSRRSGTPVTANLRKRICERPLRGLPHSWWCGEYVHHRGTRVTRCYTGYSRRGARGMVRVGPIRTRRKECSRSRSQVVRSSIRLLRCCAGRRYLCVAVGVNDVAKVSYVTKVGYSTPESSIVRWRGPAATTLYRKRSYRCS